LPTEPKWHKDLANHPLRALFEQAEKDHLRGHENMKTWIGIPQNAQGKQILDCMWVYIYKFDKHGRLQKCKARLVVRGSSETYATTLAV
jgi:hypothetical protein